MTIFVATVLSSLASDVRAAKISRGTDHTKQGA